MQGGSGWVGDRMEVTSCRVSERPGLIAALDGEFVGGKGRTISLSVRFPRLFSAANLCNVHVARVDGVVAAAAASQPFVYVDGGRRWRCASVGAVWTEPTFRRRGLGSAVLQSLERAHREIGTEALTLWTTKHAFYSGLGWILDDIGLFGTCASESSGKPSSRIQPRPVLNCDIAELERLRRRECQQFVYREAIDWQVIPLPATSVEAYVTGEGYCLVGSVGGTGYVYELVGRAPSVADIWGSLTERYSLLAVNGCMGEVSSWLTTQGLQLSPQRLAMWLPLTDEAARRLAGRLYVPYLDRV